MKRDTAVVFRCTPNLSFAVANMIVGIEKHNPHFVTDYVIFSTDNKDKDHNILYDVCRFYNKNIKIVNYSYDKLYKLNLDFNKKKFFKNYPLIIFSLFEIFNLLDEYKNVLALDADMVVIDRFDDIVNLGNFSFRPARLLNDQLNDEVKVFGDSLTPNAGFIYINDTIQGYKSFTNKCYDLLYKYFNNIKNTFEETIIGILIYNENIKYTKLELEYNCPCCSSKSIDAKIIHYLNVKKPWNSVSTLRAIPEYVYNVHKVNKITNNKYKNIDISRVRIDNIFERDFNLAYFKILYDNINIYLPDYIYPDLSPENSFLSLFIKNIDRRIHYNLRIRRGKINNIRDSFDDMNKQNNINYIELWIVFEEHEFNEYAIKKYIKELMDKKEFVFYESKFPRYYKKINIDTFFEELIYNIYDLYNEIVKINTMFELKKRGK